jgi:hypothetical protein
MRQKLYKRNRGFSVKRWMKKQRIPKMKIWRKLSSQNVFVAALLSFVFLSACDNVSPPQVFIDSNSVQEIAVDSFGVFSSCSPIDSGWVCEQAISDPEGFKSLSYLQSGTGTEIYTLYYDSVEKISMKDISEATSFGICIKDFETVSTIEDWIFFGGFPASLQNKGLPIITTLNDVVVSILRSDTSFTLSFCTGDGCPSPNHDIFSTPAVFVDYEKARKVFVDFYPESKCNDLDSEDWECERNIDANTKHILSNNTLAEGMTFGYLNMYIYDGEPNFENYYNYLQNATFLIQDPYIADRILFWATNDGFDQLIATGRPVRNNIGDISITLWYNTSFGKTIYMELCYGYPCKILE